MQSLEPTPSAPRWSLLHSRALQAGEAFYWDPEMGLWVMTAEAHLKRGSCCQSQCRHCPYGDFPAGQRAPDTQPDTRNVGLVEYSGG